MMGNIFYIGSHIASCAPCISAGNIEGRAKCIVSSGCCNLWLACVIPFENAIGRYLLVEYGRQSRHFQVSVGSDEATTIAASFSLSGECYHVASLQFKGPDAIVKFRFGQSIHVASTIFCAEVVARLTFVSFLGING